ncbi:MAG: hypothetical protein H6737_22335 [Alphaproteobacteria bacterium]|nr:hypothetical protein [Alphaproteobacteria bacterium]
MSRIALLGALAMLVGCTSENELLGEPPPARAVNPPEPENPEQLDRIVQVQQPKVDILFVIDNSCSMLEEQTALANNFSPFMEFFTGSGLDYHIGVVSTDMDDQANHIGKLQQAGGVSYIDNSMPFQQANQIFSQMAIMGTSGSYEEKGRAAAYTMVELKPEIPRNVGFYRDEAALQFVFISDEEDQSGSNPITRPEFREWMATKKVSPDLVVSHAIIDPPGQPCPAGDTDGAEYERYSIWTGGVVFNLCEPDWGPFMDELGLQTSGLKREFFLSKIPVTDPWSIDVKVVISNETGNDITLGFPSCLAGEEIEDTSCRVTYNPGRNSIVFLDYVPEPFAQILVKYNIRENFAAGGQVTDDIPAGG